MNANDACAADTEDAADMEDAADGHVSRQFRVSKFPISCADGGNIQKVNK